MKEKVVIYGLGKCWDDNWKKIASDYEIVCCIDRNPEKRSSIKGYVFAELDNLVEYEYDKLIICSYGVGIREEIILQSNVQIEKIYYYVELYENYHTRPEKSQCSKYSELTIVIPTYNRKERLSRTLNLLEKQTCKKFKIIILDNCSDYNIKEILDNREEEFKKKVEIKQNISNIGMHGNLALSFLQVNHGWLWTLSDDDIPSVYAVELIMQAIEKNKNAGAIWFSIHNLWKYMEQDGIEIGCLKELTDLSERIIKYGELDMEGDFIFFSNKVFNVQCIKEFLDKVFTFSYTGVPQIMPILFMLDEKCSGLIIVNKKIITYDYPENDHWDMIRTALGMSTITDLPLENVSERKKLYRLLMVNSDWLLEYAMRNCTYEIVNALEKLYNNIYENYLNIDEKERYLKAVSQMKERLAR